MQLVPWGLNMRKILLSIIFVLFAVNTFGADYYIAQTATGSGDASSCANAKIYSWNWTTPNVADGDTVHLCGTITSTLNIPISGSSVGITVKFESGAKFSKTAWGTDASGAIYSSGKNYIIIDGGSNGIIENTNNGTALGLQQDTTGIYLNGGSNITIKNLTIKNLYVRTPNSQDSNSYASAIHSIDTGSLTINNNTIYGAYYLLLITAASGNPSGLSIYSNDLSQFSTAIVVRLDGSSNYSNVNIYNNTIYDSYVWDGCWGGTGDDYCTSGTWFHRDGIHTWGNYSGKTVGTVTIYNNTFTGDWGVSGHYTSFIGTTDYTTPVVIYNNLFNVTNQAPSTGWIWLANYTGINSSARIYNNTLVNNSGGNGGDAIYNQGGTWSTMDIKNNIFSGIYIGIYDVPGTATITSDYNDFYNVTAIGRAPDASWRYTLANWQTYLGGCPGTGKDCNSVITAPPFTSSSVFTLTTAFAGTDLSAYFTTDILGVTRSSFDMGAYEYVSVSSTAKSIGVKQIGGQKTN